MVLWELRFGSWVERAGEESLERNKGLQEGSSEVLEEGVGPAGFCLGESIMSTPVPKAQ